MSSEFARRIKAGRVTWNLTQSELARRVGCDHTYISKLENDGAERPPSVALIGRIATEICDSPGELAMLAGQFNTNDALREITESLWREIRKAKAGLRYDGGETAMIEVGAALDALDMVATGLMGTVERLRELKGAPDA